MKPQAPVAIPLHTPLRHGKRRLRIALVGAPGGGKSTLFHAVQATSVRSAALAGSHHAYESARCRSGWMKRA